MHLTLSGRLLLLLAVLSVALTPTAEYVEDDVKSTTGDGNTDDIENHSPWTYLFGASEDWGEEEELDQGHGVGDKVIVDGETGKTGATEDDGYWASDGHDEDDDDDWQVNRRDKRQSRYRPSREFNERYRPPDFSDTAEDLSRYMRSCEDCLVDHEDFQCPLHDPALELKKWITELQNLLSFGCQRGDQCNRMNGKCCHNNDPTLARMLGDMADAARRMYDTFQTSCSDCPRDAGWSEWCAWSGCSERCGSGVRTRSRMCNNPPPLGRGRPCEGAAVDTQICNGTLALDGNWGSWSMWSACSDSCGAGMKERVRACNNPPANECGRICPGPDKDMRICDPQPEPGWGPWEPWSPCAQSCGEGQRERRRCCNNRCGTPCPGPSTETGICPNIPPCDPPCVPPSWTEWSPWSPCSTTCGRGQRERVRTCYSPSPCPCETNTCAGQDRQVDDCMVQDVVDGNWGPWGRWDACSATYDEGFRTRSRQCSNPPPNSCGSPCPGSPLDSERCCVAVWGQWEEWCPCSCRKGVRSRRRGCTLCGKEADISLCFQESRTEAAAKQEEQCDVRVTCPQCLRAGDCAGREDGVYPSCSSCNEYITCNNGQGETLRCRTTSEGPHEWDHFVQKCIPDLSTSCTLVSCRSPSACFEEDSAVRLPSCRGCSTFIDCTSGRDDYCRPGEEFNAHFARCMMGESPTCVVPANDRFLDSMIRDAPEERYIPDEKRMTVNDRQQLYVQLRVRVGEAAKYNRTDQDFLDLHLKSTQKGADSDTGVKENRTVTAPAKSVPPSPSSSPSSSATARKADAVKEKDRARSASLHQRNSPPANCRRGCDGLKPGTYPSCRGCGYFILCTRHGDYRELACKRRRLWDDDKKKCRRRSRTCKSSPRTKNITRP